MSAHPTSHPGAPQPTVQLLPQAVEAERGLLSSFFQCPKEIGSLCAERKIGDAHFHLPAHQILFRLLFAWWLEERAIDLITVTQGLRDRGDLEEAGGAGYVTEVCTYIPTAANAGRYAEILQEKLFLREVITMCNEYSARSYREPHEVHSIIAEAQERIAALGQSQATRIPTMDENIREAAALLQGRVEGSEKIIPTGLAALDDECGPLFRGNLMVIGGQTKAGKSILSAQIALNVALSGRPVLYLSLEMNEAEITKRLLCNLARLNERRAKEWGPPEWARLAEAARTLKDLPLTIVTRTYQLAEIVAVCQRFAARPGAPLAVIVLDYVQLTEGLRSGKEDRRQQEIALISRTCKRLAGTLNVLFLLLSQLNDEGRTREARDIENDANLMVEVGHDRETDERAVKVVLSRSTPSGQQLRLRVLAEHTCVEDAPDMVFPSKGIRGAREE